MMQPETTSGAVAKPNSSAPSSAPMMTSRPVFSWPSTCTLTRSRRPLTMSVCCVSARPISHGVPACLSELSGLAPVPPSWPETSTTSAFAFATPAATAPMPDCETSFTCTRAARVRPLEVEDQLLEVLDRVDVVVRRRRDEPDAGGRVPGARDPRVDLAGRQLPALAGLRALRHLDLDVVGVRQVHARDAEAARGDLLDRAAALRVEQPVDVLAALAGVRLRAEPVHRDRERLVRLLRDRAVAHRPGREALHDRCDRLDLVDRAPAPRRCAAAAARGASSAPPPGRRRAASTRGTRRSARCAWSAAA